MKKPLWHFNDSCGTFISRNANEVGSLYLPLCNKSPLMGSITADLHGDLKTGFNNFLLTPVSRPALSELKSSRNFWIYFESGKTSGRAWSATGVSKDLEAIKHDAFSLEAGMLWQKTHRTDKKTGLKAEITSFIPSSDEPVEIMKVELTNASAKTLFLTPTAAIPIYGRSAHNLHDHRHVTSLLMRVKLNRFGVLAKPTLAFDEAGHKKNNTAYFVYGIDSLGRTPEHIFATQDDFCGEGGDLEAPEAVLENRSPAAQTAQGKEAIGGLRFKRLSLRPKASLSFIVVLGIVDNEKKAGALFSKFNTLKKIDRALNKTRAAWMEISEKISVKTADGDFDNWFRWVSIQPTLRKIFGCSFLPDFDYGKGGRGWRDLWQDCLCLILSSPDETRQLLINNFAGVRIDGTNATIIGQKPGEFIADRNNITRVWMDHGIWPLITTDLYINQSSDIDILLEKTAYFRDMQLCRSRVKDSAWMSPQGGNLKTENGTIYQGTILEHILVENCVQFFNVGEHNMIRLENADWNDGLDMAGTNGESVAFTAMYAQNLATLARLIENLGHKNITVFKELLLLLDTLNTPLDYTDPTAKNKRLNEYFEATKLSVSGETVAVDSEKIIADLRKKSASIAEGIRQKEWLKEGFFNGYYNDDKLRVEGNIKGKMRMTLTGQVFPIMSAVATKNQALSAFKSARRYLRSSILPGFRLNSDFGEEQHNLGRAFSFVYGEKENGAYFNHMSVMFAYALYKQGLVDEGYEVFSSISKMAIDSAKSRIYPCLPEYFDLNGRGMYGYLTGSASWFVLTILTQVFGVRGDNGNLLIEPKLKPGQFDRNGSAEIKSTFAGKKLLVRFLNPKAKDYNNYTIEKVTFNGKTLPSQPKQKSFTLLRDIFLKAALKSNLIEIKLS